MKRCSTLAPYRERQVKTTVRYYNAPFRMAKVKRVTAIPNAGKDGGNLDHPHIAERDIKWHSPSGNQFGSVLKTKHATNI